MSSVPITSAPITCDETVAAPRAVVTRRTPWVSACLALALFGGSGAAGLVYEVSWARQFGAVFGHTAHTGAMVLASYLGGLACGYWCAGRFLTARQLTARRASGREGLALYGGLELVAAGWACLVPWLAGVGYAGLGSLDPGPWHVLDVLRAITVFALLFPATAALGATWPAMAAYLTAATSSPRWLSWGYAINTAGALAGSVLATGWLLPTAGVRTSSYLAGALSAACGLLALGLARWSGNPQPQPGATEEASAAAEDAAAADRSPPIPLAWWLLAGFSGFAVLALEVLYLRLFSLVFHNSTYTFGAVIAVFLLALALGSALTGLLPRISPASLAAGACGVGGLGVALSVALFIRWTGFAYFTAGESLAEYLTAALSLVAGVVLLPITALGMVLPATWRAAEPRPLSPAQVAGLTATSTLAGAAGSLAASFCLPVVGLWGGLLGLAGIYFALSLAYFVVRGPRMGWLLLLLAAVPVADQGWRAWPSAHTLQPGDKLLQRWEGAYGWIDVVEMPDRSRHVRQNLHYAFGSSRFSVERDYRQGHLPLLLHGHARDVAFLGLGTGQTSAAALTHPELESITVVELVPEAIEAARLFGETNRGVVDSPRVAVHAADARHFLAASGRQFDVIVSDLFVPWESQTGYLYTVEHYQASQRALRPGGLFCQWLPLFQLGPGEFELIADSFASVFPHVTLWWAGQNPNYAVVGLVGTSAPLEFDRSAATRGWTDPGEQTDPLLASDEAILGLLIGRWQPRSPAWLNTDEHPRVEFLTPASHAGRRKLRGDRLRDYYERVLSQLDAGVTLGAFGGQAREHAWRLERQRRRLGQDVGQVR